MSESINYFTKDDKLDINAIVELAVAFGYDEAKVLDKLQVCGKLYKGKDDYTCDNAYLVGSCISTVLHLQKQ